MRTAALALLLILFTTHTCLTAAESPARERAKEKSQEEAEATKASYMDKANAELRDWSGKIQNLEQRSQQRGARVRESLDGHIRTLRSRYEGIRQDLQRLSGSGEGAWRSFRKGVDESLQKLREDYDKAVATFRKTDKKVIDKEDDK